MLGTPNFGVRCQCGVALAVSDIESSKSVPIEELRDRLRREGWTKIVTHPVFSGGCGAGRQYRPDDVIPLPLPPE